MTLPVNFSSSSFPVVSSGNLFVVSTSYGLPITSNFKSSLYSSDVISSHSRTGVNFSPHPVMSVTLPHTGIIQPVHLPASTIHLPVSTQPSLVNILSSLTPTSAITHPMVTCTSTTVTSSVTRSSVVTVSQPVISNSVPQTSASLLASNTYPLTSVTNTLTTTKSTSTGFTTVTACLTTTTVPFVTSATHPLTRTNDQTSFSSILSKTQDQSGSIVVTSSPHNAVIQPHLLSTTTIQEDSLTKDVSNSGDTSEEEDDDGNSPQSTKEGTLAAVLALRDQYSPGLTSSITTVAQQPPIVSLDHLWSSKGNPAMEKQLKTEQDDEVNETITDHSNKPTSSPPTVSTKANTPLNLVTTTVTTTSSVQAKSSSPPAVTADITTTPSQSLDNTMGKYLQLLQQKQQAEENSPPTVTHNTYKEEVSTHA